MKATETRLLSFLRGATQFVVPIYQRPYRWEADQCRKLWGDVMRAGRGGRQATHFVGSVVYIQDSIFNVSDQPSLLVIDGQQRLTTFLLLIEALARAQGDTPLPGDLAPSKLRHYYLKDTQQEGDRAYKMLLSATDRATLQAIIDGVQLPAGHSLRLAANFGLFCALLEGVKLEDVARGISNILLVDISLERGHDNPQRIFESLNSTGKALSQADLVRNHVLMGLEPPLQERLYREHWRPMEVEFGQEAYATHFDGFMRHYLTIKSGELARLEEVYEAFKAHAEGYVKTVDDVAVMLADIHRYASLYCRLALGRGEEDRAIARAFRDVRELKVDAILPFLLAVYGDYESGIIGRDDLVFVVRLVESYLFRRAVLNIPSNSHSRTFATQGRSLDHSRYRDDVVARFHFLPSYRRFPRDQEFKDALVKRDLYNIRVRSYWLRRMENHAHKEPIAVEDYTIEHIMPQNEKVSPDWQRELGPEWEGVHKQFLHTLGNLTLTGYNAEMGAKSFSAKQDMEGGFKQSTLRLNQGLGTLPRWDKTAIEARAAHLAELALRVWPLPPKSSVPMSWEKLPVALVGVEAEASIADHPLLRLGPVAPLYRELRPRIMELDPAVTEQFCLNYVVYQAEAPFLTLVPLPGTIKLILNMPFPQVQDTRGLCQDISEQSHWGKGDVGIELGINTPLDLDYLMALIGQAFQWGMEGVQTP